MKNKKGRLNLHEALQQKSYDHGVICSYTFDPIFFEEYCLKKFNSLYNNRNLTVIIDRGTYEQAILGPEPDRPKQANLRYLLHPVSVPGVFHPKLFLFLSTNKGRLILGSANFSRPGITSNAELIVCYDFEKEKDESFAPLFQTAFTFLVEISKRWPCDALTSNLQEISRDVPWLNTDEKASKENNIELISNLDIPLWEQIISGIKPPVDTIYILSRYIDANPNILNRLEKDLHPKKVKIFTQNGITTLTDTWLRHPLVKNRNVEILLCEYKDDNYLQNLHAKAIAIKKKDKYDFVFGSANFTSPGMFNASDMGNVEILLRLCNLTSKDIEPEKLFDPNKSAFLLKDEKILMSTPIEERDDKAPKHEITLLEAILVEEKINIRANIPQKIFNDSLYAKMTFQGDAQKSLVLSHLHNDKYFVNAPEDIIQHLGKSSTIVKIEAYQKNKRRAMSNSILIINLLDIQTGQSVRRERRIKEAQQSAIQFFEVLIDLIEEGDYDALVKFLTYCDIPVTDVFVPIFRRGAKPAWNGSKGMRNLGEKNSEIFVDLHKVVVYFWERHFRKLQQHVDRGGLNGIPNFMHIFLAMGGVICAQIERALLSLELKSKPMSPDEWYVYRKHINEYYLRFTQQVTLLHNEYLLRIQREYDLKKISELLIYELPTLQKLVSDFLNYHQRFESVVSEMSVVTLLGKKICPPPSKPEIFSKERWPPFNDRLNQVINNIKNIVTRNIEN